MANSFKKTAVELLAAADVKINGSRPWDIRVFDERFYQRALSQGTLGLGESYMDNWWDAESLDQFFYQVLNAELQKKIKGFPRLWIAVKAVLLNLQRRSKAYKIGEKHYDIGNDLYTLMLDKRMNYSGAYWKDAKNLDQAQEAKLDLICKKLGLKPGMSVLDIGSGWGGFAKYAAEKYNVKVVGITVSKEQVKLAREICNGLPVDIRLQDYRNLEGKFDRIVSIGMIEHVGYKNYRIYMKVVYDCLHEDGLFLLQTIGSNKSEVIGDAWMDKYIFPDGMLPSPAHITKAVEGLFIMEDWHNFGADYDKTLMAWYSNFEKNWDTIKQNKKYDERFYRMWKYYLLSCAGSFRARNIQLWQIVFSRKGIPGGYTHRL
ncbi:MAG: cyclopropane fatty acyl phospholipid synthase [Candidatus Aminicenantes bacterium]|nr:cyclopropane fatty acyl phospholipid synthase [Candidatus Aminicenantes bacterium]NIM77490.1 cyclopropane fatty acyl phospholipid synthase [Candidatus Aminicenantes bacterium]NIN16798.1 cyclopropane fatty acyl phospholipid synthase [Candidatus Aminicenantes bacterium]NIN40652.1 cyclopropane fatty acyl phospholipid synthase [Candidatus Aminicenantes bacterium]NIN83477.1 cyclopropane fatty acyl phospholipid synthase [Candidatus Aminicenantes bacterium]